MLTTNNNKQILILTSYPSRPCGIATYSQDLIQSINKKFKSSFSVKICALEDGENEITYPDEVKYTLNTSKYQDYIDIAEKINNDPCIEKIFIQHEFGLFGGNYGEYLFYLFYALKKPVSITFHTVIPAPEEKRKKIVQSIAAFTEEIIVMTEHSLRVLTSEYDIPESKISVIPHGTHIVPYRDKSEIKKTLGYNDRLILSNFGLLSSNKSIETALDALPKIINEFPQVLFLVLGRTHPGIIKQQGESYREFLEEKVTQLNIQDNVQFINKYLELPEILEYLQLTDVYLFTSKDPNQAVSGTFAYALSSGCPIISTPIPYAREMLKNNTGIIIDFNSPGQLAEATIKLLGNSDVREEMSSNAFHYTRTSAWENTAIAHANIFWKYMKSRAPMKFDLPAIDLQHVKTMTTEVGILQFSKLNRPDVSFGYTLDDNARALIALCMHYGLYKNQEDLVLINTYLNFIEHCQQTTGDFLNYLDKDGKFHIQNNYTNLEDSNGRAVWSLGVLLSHHHHLPWYLTKKAEILFDNYLPLINQIESPRAMAFAIKGLYFQYKIKRDQVILNTIDSLAGKLVEKYHNSSDSQWKWFEGYLTYANSILPEALLYAYLATNKMTYKITAHISFEFLLSHTFKDNWIKVVSNRGWHHKDKPTNQHGEQPIDVSYTIQALELFYSVFKDDNYRKKMDVAFSWFLGNNHLKQTIYNPVTGGCYDGLEKDTVNLNQGAESAVCYLIARLIMEKNTKSKKRNITAKKGLLVYSTRKHKAKTGYKRRPSDAKIPEMVESHKYSN